MRPYFVHRDSFTELKRSIPAYTAGQSYFDWRAELNSAQCRLAVQCEFMVRRDVVRRSL